MRGEKRQFEIPKRPCRTCLLILKSTQSRMRGGLSRIAHDMGVLAVSARDARERKSSGNTGVHRCGLMHRLSALLYLSEACSVRFFSWHFVILHICTFYFYKDHTTSSMYAHGMLSYHAPCEVNADGTVTCWSCQHA